MLKKILGTAALLFINILLFAQVPKPGFSISADVGFIKPFTDVNNSDLHAMFKVGIQYHLSSFTSINVDFSKGELLKKEFDRYQRKYNNDYSQYNATLNVRIGQFIKNAQHSNLFHNLYVGSGIGIIKSNVTEPSGNVRDALNGKRYEGSDYIIPINAGLDLPFPGSKNLTLNLNYQFNYAITDELDGYTSFTDNEVYDTFNVLSMGIRYAINSKRNGSKGKPCFNW